MISEQMRKWLDSEIQFLDYSKLSRHQFTIDIREAVKEGLLHDYIEAVSYFPLP